MDYNSRAAALVRGYVTTGKIQEAIKILLDSDIEGAMLISASYSNLKRAERNGTISHDNQILEQNRINNRILSCVGGTEIYGGNNVYIANIEGSNININQPTSQPVNQSTSQPVNQLPTGADTAVEFESPTDKMAKLATIVKDFKRINADLSERAGKLRSEWNDHDSKRKTEPNYDKKGRMEKALVVAYEAIIKEVSETEDKTIVGQQKQVEKLLSGTLSWVNLQKAFDIAAENGFKSETIETQLKAKKGSDLLKARIAGDIETFMDGL